MAIAFARVSYHSRSKGHSAVAGAAYRAGKKLMDKRTGEIHDFKNRRDIVHTELLLPDGALEKFNDRELLWNAAEAAEKRSNSQVAKDIVLALPRGLDRSHHIELTKNFAQYHFVQHGIPADIAIHDHGEGNPHAHIYIPTRRLHKDRFDKYKARDLEPDVARGRVVNPQYWGEQWRNFQSEYFQKHSLDVQVDANYIISQRHEGRFRNEKNVYVKEENRFSLEASIKIAVNDPESVLNILGTKHAVFSEQDIVLLINKNTRSQEQFNTAFAKLKAHRDLILLGPGDDGHNRFTTRANYLREAIMADHADKLILRYEHTVSLMRAHIAAYKFGLNLEQTEALSHVAKSGDICAIVGRAGTGKSYMMKAAKLMWENAGFNIKGMAVSGIASKGLEESTGIPSTTIYALKNQIERGKQLSANDILVMDEAGMTDLNDFAFMVNAVKKAGAKLVLVGDHAQLQPIGPGAPFRAIVERIGFAELNHIQRQNDSGDRAASSALSQGDIEAAVDYYAAKKQIHLINADRSKSNKRPNSNKAIELLVSNWGQGLSLDNLPKRLILAHRNFDVNELNQEARLEMHRQGFLGNDSHHVIVTDGVIEISQGDRILFLRNNRSMGISNGEFATILEVDNDKITVKLDRQSSKTFTFSTKDYQDFNYGYAATVHKSQGVTVDNAFVYIAGSYWDRYLSYVAMTRHRECLNIYVDAAKEQFKDLDALKDSLSREAPKDSVLDWPLSYAIRRGFDPDSLAGQFIESVANAKQALKDKWLFISNYSALKQKHLYQRTKQSRQALRGQAKNVSLMISLKKELSSQARKMHHELKDGEKFFNHPKYDSWYKQVVLRNSLASNAIENYSALKQILDANGIDEDNLKQMANANDRLLLVNSYVQSMLLPDNSQNAQGKLAVEISSNIRKYYSELIFAAKTHSLDIKGLIEQLHTDSALHRQKAVSEKTASPSPSNKDFADEWEKLKSINSNAVSKLLEAKKRLDKADTPSEVLIQTKAYQLAAKNISSINPVLEKIRSVAPNVLNSIKQAKHELPVNNIDWLSPESCAEINKLRGSTDRKIDYLVKFHDKLISLAETSKQKMLIKQLESIAQGITQNKNKLDIIERLSPEFRKKLLSIKIAREKMIDRGF